MIVVFQNKRLEQPIYLRTEAVMSFGVEWGGACFGFRFIFQNLKGDEDSISLEEKMIHPKRIPTAIVYAEALNLVCIRIDENFDALFSELEEEINAEHLQIGSKIYRK